MPFRTSWKTLDPNLGSLVIAVNANSTWRLEEDVSTRWRSESCCCGVNPRRREPQQPPGSQSRLSKRCCVMNEPRLNTCGLWVTVLYTGSARWSRVSAPGIFEAAPHVADIIGIFFLFSFFFWNNWTIKANKLTASSSLKSQINTVVARLIAHCSVTNGAPRRDRCMLGNHTSLNTDGERP